MLAGLKKGIDTVAKPWTGWGWCFPFFLLGSFGLTAAAVSNPSFLALVKGWFGVMAPQNVAAGTTAAFNAVAPAVTKAVAFISNGFNASAAAVTTQGVVAAPALAM